MHAWAHWVLGEAARSASPADLDAAGRAYGAALELACELGMRALEAHCRSGKARIAAARGDEEAADAHARRAREIAGDIGLAPGADASSLPRPA